MLWSDTFMSFFLLSVSAHGQQPDAPLTGQDIIEVNSGIEVAFGRSVFIDPTKDLKIKVRDGDRCTVTVIQNDPLSQRPGKLVPSHFPCQFGVQEVQYFHFGARTPPQDRVKLILRYDTVDDTIIVPFTIHVEVLFVQLEVVTKNMPIVVENLLGISAPFDDKALQFSYDRNNQKCEVMVLGKDSGLPRYGEILNHTTNGVMQDCDSFLKADIRYKHTFVYHSPNQDHVPMVVEVTDPDGNLMKQEYFHLTVKIKDGHPNNPPQADFSSLLLLDINQFIMTAITSRVLSAQDLETPLDYLIFNITSPLGYGEGHIVSTDDQNVPITSFYQKDLNDLKIAYSPPASDSNIKRTFDIKMEVIDAEGLSSEPFSLMIVVHPKNTLAPLATRNSGLMLFEGQSRRLQSSKNLEIADEDNIDEVIVSVSDGLRHGQLLFMGSPVKQFSPADLDAGLVTYEHDGSETYSDNIIFMLNDGTKQAEFLFPVVIYPDDDEPPVLSVNTGVTITEGEEIEINPFVLSATDVDSDDFKIIYELQQPFPSEGEIFKTQFDVPNDLQSWQFVDGKYERPVTTWTQQDLLEGGITYRHSGDHKTEPVIDRIRFRVSDDNIPPNESNDEEFLIKIMPLDKIPPEPYPGTPLEMIVDEFENTDITKKHLHFTDIDTKDRKLKYKITRKPYDTDSNNLLDSGKLVLSEKPDQEVTEFTQAQINHHKIAYSPPSVEQGIVPRIIQFEFQVEDLAGNVLPGQIFIIRLLPVDNKPPIIRNKGLEVFENGFVNLTPDVLDADDVDTDPNFISFTLKQVPNNGNINLRGVKLENGDNFTKKDIVDGLINYVNSGAEKDNDKFEVEVSDGIHKVPITINVKIQPIDDEPPALQITPGTIGLSIDVKEGGRTPITNKVIKATDPDTDDLKITFLIDNPPTQGKIELNGISTDKFTQEDIEKNTVFYVHDGDEIGEDSIMDTFKLSVSDMSNDLLLGGNKISYVQVDVNIEPVDNVAPEVTVGPELVVAEANKTTISMFHLNATDVDTKDDDIVCTIQVQPLHGYVENISPAPGSEKSRIGIPVTAFKISDIKRDHINYVQSVHKSVEPINDSLTFSCSDGINFSPHSLISIKIEPTNDEIPEIFMREFIVQEGMKLSIDLPILNADDLDVPEDILVFRVKTKPEHGKIVIQLATGDEEINSFTLDQISFGSNILYEHDDSETTEDVLELELTDGLHNISKKVLVIVLPVDDETPRLAINDGLEVGDGESKIITNTVLKAEDLDTEDSDITFVVRQPPKHGELIILDPLTRLPLFNLTKGSNFTQGDIDEELIMYTHTGREGVRDLIKFDVTDGYNTYVDRYFWISVEGADQIFPDVINKGVELPEGGKVTLTTDVISTSDINSDDEHLRFTITRSPTRGHLESTDNPGVPIISFTQMDLAGNKIYYVHTDDKEIKMDSFEFEVTDGYNSVYRTFRISISDIDNKKPLLFLNTLRVLEGGEKIITPFEVKVEDKDTDDKKVKFTITQNPVHGKILYNQVQPIKVFTLEDLRQNKVSYHHDGSESTLDGFSFTITDGTHMDFYVYPDTVKETRKPQTLEIKIVPFDNSIPQIVINKGASSIDPLDNGQLGYRFTNKILRAEDSDSQNIILEYIITVPPKHGTIINKAVGNESISNFTQGDIDQMNIYYILDSLVNATNDVFHFNVVDEGKNELSNQKFQLNWAWISLEYLDSYKVNETEKYLNIKLYRRGYLGETSFVSMKTKNITANEGEDFGKHYAKQVQFSPGQTEAYWRLRILNDSLFEDSETFEISLEEPVMAAIEYPDKAIVTILDKEDVSTVEFYAPEYHVREDVGEVLIPIKRTGDLRKEMMVVCSTESDTATGTIPSNVQSFSDFISRPENHKNVIRFKVGQEQRFCRVVIIDDSLFEEEESFNIRLSLPMGGQVGEQNETRIVIVPDNNDAPLFYFGESEYYVDESDGYIDVKVWRTGTDLSKPASVTVRSKPSEPPSAEAGNDYVGIGKNLDFPPGVTLETFRVTILDDLGQPIIEGSETFELVLRMPMNAELGDPSQALVTINDSISDLPMMQFQDSEYVAFENDGNVTAYILRSGDISDVTTVRCYTRQDTAKVEKDFVERPNTDYSLVYFEPGEIEKPCTVILVNDTIHEKEEVFRLRLGSPSSETAGGAMLGPKNVTKIRLKDPGDQPIIKFEKVRYNVKEPLQPGEVTMVEVPVIRNGDLSKSSHVRVHTKDGSAKSGKDYSPFSKELEFGQNVSKIIIKIEILYSKEKEHREAFTVHLRPDRDMIADIQDNKAIIYIQEVNIVADVTFPSKPLVVSLKDYDSAANAVSPIPGYPVVCITACNPKYPDYEKTGVICTSEGINDTLTEYGWRVAAPSGQDGVTSDLKNSESRTFFTDTHHITLDSIYFSPGSRVQCIARAVNQDGDVGLELESEPVVISVSGGLCSPRIEGSTGAEPFTAKMRYTGPDEQNYPNLIKLTIVIPHRDGMLPVISSQPLSNFELTLSPDNLRVGTHKCSNLLDYNEVRTKNGFLTNETRNANIVGEVEPYQFSPELRTEPTLRFYRNLDLEACMWDFTTYYDMSELVTDCGGAISSDGQVFNSVQSFVSVRVPLYVSYIYHSPVATGGWQHNDLTSRLRLTFVYDTAILWKNGIKAPEESQLKGNLYPTSMRIRDDGRLVVNFRTEPRFKGQFVLSHPGSGLTSMVTSQGHPELTFTLELIHSEPTYAQPDQQWEVVSDLAVRDYSGNYNIKLIPCTATAEMEYSLPLRCNPRDPIPFDIQVRFQQVSDPVPVEFSLNTQFHLMRKKALWVSDGSMGFGEDSDVSFVPGDEVFGRIMVDPIQNLGDSFHMTIEKCFLCTGENGYVPKYNPYNSEYGCMADSPNLLHSFKIIDRGAPNTVKRNFRNVPFNAQLAADDQDPDTDRLNNQSGSDGFRFDSAPLFQVSFGTQWFVHCIYTIRSEKNAARGIGKRSVPHHALHSTNQDLSRRKRASEEIDEIGKDGVGTNMNRILLDYEGKTGIVSVHPDSSDTSVYQIGTNSDVNHSETPLIQVIVGLACSSLVVIVVVVVLARRKRTPDTKKCPPSYTPTEISSNGQTRLIAPQYYSSSGDNTEV